MEPLYDNAVLTIQITNPSNPSYSAPIVGWTHSLFIFNSHVLSNNYRHHGEELFIIHVYIAEPSGRKLLSRDRLGVVLPCLYLGACPRMLEWSCRRYSDATSPSGIVSRLLSQFTTINNDLFHYLISFTPVILVVPTRTNMHHSRAVILPKSLRAASSLNQPVVCISLIFETTLPLWLSGVVKAKPQPPLTSVVAQLMHITPLVVAQCKSSN
jgi:hypothetical protein